MAANAAIFCLVAEKQAPAFARRQASAKRAMSHD
jgi:hypothetical protein